MEKTTLSSQFPVKQRARTTIRTAIMIFIMICNLLPHQEPGLGSQSTQPRPLQTSNAETQTHHRGHKHWSRGSSDQVSPSVILEKPGPQAVFSLK